LIDPPFHMPDMYDVSKPKFVMTWEDPAVEALRYMRRNMRLVFVPDPEFEVVLKRVTVDRQDRIWVETWEEGRGAIEMRHGR